jgi:uncharacterized protein (TIGR02611 family)
MIAKAKQSWRRFQDPYRRQQKSEHGWRDPRRLLYVVGGLILALGSLAFGVLPGPGMLTFFVGLGMIAGEFRPVARLLDWAEVRAREFGRWVGGIWRSSAGGKVLVVFVGSVLCAVVLRVAYLLLFTG